MQTMKLVGCEQSTHNYVTSNTRALEMFERCRVLQTDSLSMLFGGRVERAERARLKRFAVVRGWEGGGEVNREMQKARCCVSAFRCGYNSLCLSSLHHTHAPARASELFLYTPSSITYFWSKT